MKVSAYYLTPTGQARIKAEAQRMGQRLRELRAERETAQVLARAALPAIPQFTLERT